MRVIDRESLIIEQAELLKAMGHPLRVALLEELRQGEECVCHLAHLFNRPQPYVSKQLAALREAGLVLDRRDGQRVFYQLANENIAGLLDAARAASGRGTDEILARPGRPGCPCRKCQ